MTSSNGDFLPLKAIDHVEFWVGNAFQARHFYEKNFGFKPVARAGLETGVRDRSSYVLEQGEIRYVLTTGLDADSEIADHVRRHGDGVRDICLLVDDVDYSFEQTVKRGARPVAEPYSVEDEHGSVRRAIIATYGDTVHSFINRSAYKGPFLPSYQAMSAINGHAQAGDGSSLQAIDHIVGNVELGRMDEWVDFYAKVMGFELFVHYDDEDIHTEYSALMSKVMADGDGKIKFPINEPAEGRKKSQIQEYLEYYGGPGVQHIAMRTDNIVATIDRLKGSGVEFLEVPASYYEITPERVGHIDESWRDIQRLSILADRDQDGYLLQIFTKPVEDRPTLFYEVIERHGARGFGIGNFKALFESIEREQERRGNL
ncbi:MAG: 4-hydroxyphenylpyruvate dioxygenase [Dehalococcoidia bacterium]